MRGLGIGGTEKQKILKRRRDIFMKKNKMMRLASGLLVLTLLTTCIISGTFAKYVASGETSDSARVAKWGVTVTAKENTMFGKVYKDKTNGNSVSSSATYDSNSDSVNSTDFVVAPGTNGEMADITISGQPEVDVEVTYVADLTLTNWQVSVPSEEELQEDPSAGEEGGEAEAGGEAEEGDPGYYCPIVITITKADGENGAQTESKIDGKTFKSMSAFENAVNEAINSYSKTYTAGTKLDNQSADNLKISWAWAFEKDSEDTSDIQTDENDTALTKNDELPTIALNVTATVTQVD
jgi:hypothetical protein